MSAGDHLADLVGPLGKATEIENYGTVLLVGGGGIAALFPIVKALKQGGNRVITVLGAKNKDLMILAEECAAWSDQLILMTDDGSLGAKGSVTDAMQKVFAEESGTHYGLGNRAECHDEVLYPDRRRSRRAHLCLFESDYGGRDRMRGGCRVTVDDQIKFACVDGPEFLGAGVTGMNLSIGWGSIARRKPWPTKIMKRR